MGSPITTHILDTARGCPAAGVPVTLARHLEEGWVDVADGVTDDDGRIGDLLPEGAEWQAATYRLTFCVGGYFEAQGVPSFYSSIPIVFNVEHPDQHYHVPLLLSPFSYSTYRGS